MSNKLSVLVIGATGKQGGAVTSHLIPKGHNIRTLTRNVDSAKAKQLKEKGVEVVKGDLTDPGSLIQAMQGMDTVFAMTTPFEAGVEAETQQGITLADAAKQAGVGHFVFSSVASADQDTNIPHFDSKHKVEEYLAKLGIPYTISAPVYFMDNLFEAWFLPSVKEGALKFGMPVDRVLQQISVDNIGAFGAALIERRESVFGKRFDIAGDELTGAEAMKIVSQASGKNIGYESFDPEIMRADNPDFAEMFLWFNRVGYSANISGLRRDFPEVNWGNYKEWANRQDWKVVQ